jgi:hypothetical protein
MKHSLPGIFSQFPPLATDRATIINCQSIANAHLSVYIVIPSTMKSLLVIILSIFAMSMQSSVALRGATTNASRQGADTTVKTQKDMCDCCYDERVGSTAFPTAQSVCVADGEQNCDCCQESDMPLLGCADADILLA